MIVFNVVLCMPLKECMVFHIWLSGVNLLNVFMYSAHASCFAVLMVFLHVAFVLLYSICVCSVLYLSCLLLALFLF